MKLEFTRRGLLGAGAAAALPSLGGLAYAAEEHGLKLGVATYSLRKFSRAEAIEILKQLRVHYLSVKSYHLAYESTPEQLQVAMGEFKAAGMTVLSAGNNAMAKDDDADLRSFFKYAKNAGIPMLVIAPSHETMPKIEKLVKEYNIRVAVHPHGPEDKHYPSPESVMADIKSMDPRVGLCLDIGHAARAGSDIVAAARAAGSRLLDMHVKDLADLSSSKSQCDVGEGKLPFPALFRQLKKMNYTGGVMLEYEINESAPQVGMAKSLAYMRGVAAALA
ncbi:MAG: sugar phosphate isomerase/epimerase [Bryobacteraceae bacterium]